MFSLKQSLWALKSWVGDVSENDMDALAELLNGADS